jgi:Na+/proline symporter
LWTDALLFVVAMSGSIAAAVYSLRHPAVGGLSGLLGNEAVAGKLSMLPDLTNPALAVPFFLIPLAVQWWAAWYPGAEPGGGGYLAQRMLAAKDERHATAATLFFNVAHYALRPWPWILVALASLVVFPDLESLATAFPHIDPKVLRQDLAYPAMLTFLPHGLLGLVVGSLAAAYMSTISTHLNWGSSYIVHDFYRRFLRPKAAERELVLAGRISTVLLMLLAAGLALQLENALQAFQILLQIGAGTGLLFILRWFWWRINAWSEITSMVVSFGVALVFFLQHGAASRTGGATLESWQELLIGVAATTVAWIAVTFLTRPTDESQLRSFYRRTRPGGPGWAAVVERAASAGEPIEAGEPKWDVPMGLMAMLAGCFAVYSALFAVGHWIYGNFLLGTGFALVALMASLVLIRSWGRVAGRSSS